VPSTKTMLRMCDLKIALSPDFFQRNVRYISYETMKTKAPFQTIIACLSPCIVLWIIKLSVP